MNLKKAENLLGTILLMEKILCEREGMIAENKWREIQGESLAYGENNFFALSNQFDHLIELLNAGIVLPITGGMRKKSLNSGQLSSVLSSQTNKGRHKICKAWKWIKTCWYHFKQMNPRKPCGCWWECTSHNGVIK